MQGLNIGLMDFANSRAEIFMSSPTASTFTLWEEEGDACPCTVRHVCPLRSHTQSTLRQPPLTAAHDDLRAIPP